VFNSVFFAPFVPLGAIRLYSFMTTITSVSPRMEQSKVNQLLGPALKSLYDIEAHLRKSTLEPALQELIKLRVSQNQWVRILHHLSSPGCAQAWGR
jgi:hypothetical protein